MKIKRYTAESMRAALSQVRLEQGPDAVILSSRRGAEGIEVVAAVDYDEALFAEVRHQRQPQQAEASAPTPLPVSPLGAVSPPGAVSRRPAAEPAPDAGFGLLQREMQSMRRLLEISMTGITRRDKRVPAPLKTQVLEQLIAMDIAPDVARAIAEAAPRRTTLENTGNLPLALLIKHLPVGDDQTCVSGGITALVGPTGAGKTTTIAKLAARWCLAHGSQDLALVSTDVYRVGAREQLMTYARALNAPVYTANSGKELGHLLARLKGKKLVLIDTAGMGPRDVRLSEQLAALKLGATRAKVLLTLPAHGECRALEQIVRAFAPVSPQACILTKLDEAASLGGVLSAVIRHKLRIDYLCNGQRVPADLHAAQPRRVWLARAALNVQRGAPWPEIHPARTFGGVHAHG